MKKLLILILSILFLGNVAMGKNKRNSNSSYKLKNKKDVIKNSKYNRGVDTTKYNTFIIEYDFKTGVYNSNNLKPTVGEPVIFKIVNINRLAYEVEIKAKDSVITGDLYIINKLLEEMPSSPLADSSNKKVNVDQELYNQKIVYEKSDFLNESDSVKNIA